MLKSRTNMLAYCSVIALSFCASTAVFAQDAAGQNEVETVVVTGIRASARSSVSIKKNTLEIVDSITAEDIGKLPDPNVAETLTRVPGVQGYRYGGEGASPVGEGSGLTIRGLSGQTASQVNGRAYFTAGGREFNIEGAIPGMIAGLDVYKNPSAEHIEGGIGGLVNVRTRRPSDFKKQTVSLGVTARYNDLASNLDPELFALYANKWDLASGGRVGVMVAGVYQRSEGRSDSTPSNGGATLRRAVRADSPEYATISAANQSYAGRSDIWFLADVPTTSPANTPNLTGLTQSQIDNILVAPTQSANLFQETIKRTRKGFNVAADWVVNDQLRLYTEANYTYYLYNQNYRFLTASDSRTVRNLTTTPFNFTESLANRNANGGADNVLVSKRLAGGTFLNSGLSTSGGDEHRPYTTWIWAFGAEWNPSEKLEIKADFNYVKADQTQDNRSVSLQSASGLSWDITRVVDGTPHQMSISGPALSSQATWVFGDYANGTRNVFDDSGYAAVLDAKYKLNYGPIESIKGGFRFAHQQDQLNAYNFSGINLTTNGLALAANRSNAIPISTLADLVETSPLNVLKGDAGYSGGYYVFSPEALLGDNVRNRFPQSGLPANSSVPEVISSRRFYSEDTTAAYIMANFSAMEDRIRGNFGVRVVKTDATARAMVRDPSTTQVAYVPNSVDTSYTNTLPSLNITGYITPDLLLRFGYGKALTRPALSALNPTISYDTVNGTGTVGNAELKPLLADSFDLSLEKYFNTTNYVSATVFDKEIDGFFNGIVQCQTVPLAPAYSGSVNQGCTGGQYLVTKTVNAEKGYVRGVELAGQYFFDDLPGVWQHFGVTASYTYLKTSNPVNFGTAAAPRIVETPTPMQSKHSYSVSGMYEDGKLSARVVYTYRSEAILFGISTNPIDGRYIGSYGILDASLNYNLTPLLTISLNGSNLTDKGLDRFVGEPDLATGLERQHFVNGRTFSLGLRYKFGG